MDTIFCWAINYTRTNIFNRGSSALTHLCGFCVVQWLMCVHAGLSITSRAHKRAERERRYLTVYGFCVQNRLSSLVTLKYVVSRMHVEASECLSSGPNQMCCNSPRRHVDKAQFVALNNFCFRHIKLAKKTCVLTFICCSNWHYICRQRNLDH